jgi:hypothetical protein
MENLKKSKNLSGITNDCYMDNIMTDMNTYCYLDKAEIQVEVSYLK